MDPEEHSPIEIPALRQALEALPGSEFVVFGSVEDRFILFGFGGAPDFRNRNQAVVDALSRLRRGARYSVQEILDALPAI